MPATQGALAFGQCRAALPPGLLRLAIGISYVIQTLVSAMSYDPQGDTFWSSVVNEIGSHS